jgi:hypothetical protein
MSRDPTTPLTNCTARVMHPAAHPPHEVVNAFSVLWRYRQALEAHFRCEDDFTITPTAEVRERLLRAAAEADQALTELNRAENAA